MYTDAVLRDIRRVLKPAGTVTIVSDNKAYTETLAAAAAALGPDEFRTGRVDSGRVHKTVDGVRIYKGEPGEAAGHVADSSSYFDRMWSRGKKTARWFIFLRVPELSPEVQPEVEAMDEEDPP